jgi:hypothetical protein
VVVALFADDAGNLEVHQAGTGCQSDPFVFITASSSQRLHHSVFITACSSERA